MSQAEISFNESQENTFDVLKQNIISRDQAEIREDCSALLQKREIIEVEGQKLEIIDNDPTIKKTHTPTVIVPGFTETSESFIGLMRGLNHAGRRTLSVYNPHGIDTEPVGKNPHPQLRKAVALLKMLDAKGVEKVDVFGHSEGAITIAIAAKLRPEKFRSIVLFNPSGMYGDDNLLTLAGRFLLEAARDKITDFTGNHTDERKELARIGEEEASKYLAASPLHSIKEILSLTSTRIDRELTQLQKQHGMSITLITTKQDLLYPLHRNPKRISREAGIPPKNIIRFKGSHISHIDEPAKIAKEVDGAFTRMENEKSA